MMTSRENYVTQSKLAKKDILLWKKLGELEFMFPDTDEQKAIGAYFKNLDHLITLHQRKYEKLQIIKKSMLENCFPKNGEKVPKIRFSGFTGDWEQRKLGDCPVVKEKIPERTDEKSDAT